MSKIIEQSYMASDDNITVRMRIACCVAKATDTHSQYTGCPTCYRTRHFFNNFTTNEDIATKFESDLPHCVRYMKTS